MQEDVDEDALCLSRHARAGLFAQCACGCWCVGARVCVCGLEMVNGGVCMLVSYCSMGDVFYSQNVGDVQTPEAERQKLEYVSMTHLQNGNNERTLQQSLPCP